MGYIVAGATLVVFVVIAVLVTGGTTAALDRDVMLGVATLHADGLTVLMQALSHIGGTLGVGIVAALGSLGLYLKGQRRAALRLAGTIAASAVVIVVTKLLFERPRPDVFPWLDHPSGDSFPSGHSLAGVLFFPLIAVTSHEVFGTPRWLIVLGLALGLAIGLSRIYLGVHWPTDVLGGFALGVMLLVLATRFRVRPLGNSPVGPS
ncbi:MAG: phosphatase PAP2 family protein [Deltaproteobacteria bacterium]|nr:phosphatase PAP2 family protein [Deltaproteobacteria bacterium]